MTRIAVIGAGMSGLAFTRALTDDARITLFEKSHGYGGRMATRRHGSLRFDHGAQFFTVKSKTFQAFLQPYMDRGIVARWDARFVELESGRVIGRRHWSAGSAHYVGVPGMSALGGVLGQKLDVGLGIRVSEISADAGCWTLRDDKGRDLGQFDWVVSSVPAMQAQTLLPESFAHRDVVNRCVMPGCYALMLGFDTMLDSGWDAAQIRNAPISWISVNSSKPGRGGPTSLLVQASNCWSEANMDSDEVSVVAQLVAETSRAIGQDAGGAEHIALHRWRYANPGLRQGAKSLVDGDRQLAAIGDWCIRGLVESAFLSAMDAAQRIRGLMAD